jgi:hypothetical protein
MPLSSLDYKKIYYYVICIMAFFVLMWGVVDLVSSSIGLVSIKAATTSAAVSEGEEGILPPEGDQLFDTYYQGKMLQDRFWDSLARIIVSGAIFGYCRFRAGRLEEES